MKAQLTFEYMISFIIFIGIIVYIYLSYSANIPNFIQEVFKEDARSKAYQLSEILVNDLGHPIDWDKSNVERVGLSDMNFNKANLMSRIKITELSGFDCANQNDYDELKDLFALDRDFSIVIFEIQDDGDRNLLFSCFPSDLKTAIQAKVTRITAYTEDGDVKPAEVIVQVW